jgi:hypothetical protein
MKYSIIIPYRDREAHLSLLLPRLHEAFADKDYEIIVSEQNNDDNFQIACVENVGAKLATGDVFVFHQVDYYPTDDVSYDFTGPALLPARTGIFLTDDLRLRDLVDIPAGYRQWSKEIDPAFYGGVILMSREQFDTINGFNPLYRGWGNEDEDIRERLKYYNIPVVRNEVGTYYVLNHKDNCPTPDEPKRYKDFMEGREMLHRFTDYLSAGVNNMEYSVSVYGSEDDPKLRWAKSSSYRLRTENEIYELTGSH